MLTRKAAWSQSNVSLLVTGLYNRYSPRLSHNILITFRSCRRSVT